jgi:hypothetical protein
MRAALMPEPTRSTPAAGQRPDVMWIVRGAQGPVDASGVCFALTAMPRERDSPFETLESAHEFVSLLREAVDDAYGSILDEITLARETRGAERRLDALRVVDHKLNSLRQNMLASLVLLNDLRTLRRLLLGERRRGAAETEEP